MAWLKYADFSEELLPYYKKFYEKHVRRVYLRCLLVIKDSAIAEEYTHDIFLSIFERFTESELAAKPTLALGSWVTSITVNYLFDRERSGDIRRDVLANTLSNTLSNEEVTLLELKQQNLSNKEIARKLKMSESAVKMRLKRLKERIRPESPTTPAYIYDLLKHYDLIKSRLKIRDKT